jgi:hypothetical protein
MATNIVYDEEALHITKVDRLVAAHSILLTAIRKGNMEFYFRMDSGYRHTMQQIVEAATRFALSEVSKDEEMLMKVLGNPEMAALLASLAKTMKT